MDESGQQHTPPSDQDGDGVRVTATAHRGRRYVALYALLALVMVGAGIAYLLNRPGPAPTGNAPAAEARRAVTAGSAVDTTRTTRRAAAPMPAEEPYEVPSRDPGDLAAHMRPGDPEPTVAELIDALHHAGIRSGIGAFNPPGTSPPLHGLAVPEDVELPEGYIRHHQVTDGGEPIEPILMFAPDHDFYDANGRRIALPENRVVPPELAPPGFPIRQVKIPPSP